MVLRQRDSCHFDRPSWLFPGSLQAASSPAQLAPKTAYTAVWKWGAPFYKNFILWLCFLWDEHELALRFPFSPHSLDRDVFGLIPPLFFWIPIFKSQVLIPPVAMFVKEQSWSRSPDQANPIGQTQSGIIQNQLQTSTTASCKCRCLWPQVKKRFITSKDIWPCIHKGLIISHFRAIHYTSYKSEDKECGSLAAWYRLDTLADKQPWGQKCIWTRWLLNSACQDDRQDTLAMLEFFLFALLSPAAKHGKRNVSRVCSWCFLKACPAPGAPSHLCSQAARWRAAIQSLFN